MVPVEMAEGTVHMANVPGIDRVVAELPKPELPPSCLDLSGCLFTLVVLPVNFDGWRVLPSHHGSESDHPDIALDSGYVHRCRANHDLSYILYSYTPHFLFFSRTFLSRSISMQCELIFSLSEFFLEHSDAVI
jgi:hypothetical protein